MGGKSKSKNSSAPVSPEQRRQTYETALNSMGGTLGWEKTPQGNYKMPSIDYSRPSYVSPGQRAVANITDPGRVRTANITDPGRVRTANITDPGEARTMTGGDYDRLEQNIVRSRLAPLARQEGLWRQQTDEDMAKRGVWSSGAAVKAQNDVTERLAPIFQQAGADAATQRYGMQADELSRLNQYGLGRAEALNSANLQNAGQANQFNLGRAGMLNDANQFNAGQANQFNLGRAGMLNDANQFNAGQANQFNLQSAGMQNQFNTDQTDKEYQSKWRPLGYLQGLWNGTGGTVSKGSSSSWNVGNPVSLTAPLSSI